jgi:hypothetical protein
VVNWHLQVGELGLGGHTASLVIARFTDRAFDVLQQLRFKHSPAAPVVDIYGAMAANLSLSDVKVIYVAVLKSIGFG